MAEPTQTKTWKHYSALIYNGEGPPAQETTGHVGSLTAACQAARQLIWEIKNALVTGSAPWEVVRSCGHNGVNFVCSDSDNWGAASNVWWPRQNGIGQDEWSWIVLKNTNILTSGSGYQILINCYGNGSPFEPWKIIVSVSNAEAGFTGGSTIAAPTGGFVCNTVADDWTTSALVPRGMHLFKSTDGECTRVFTTHNSTYYRMWMFDRGGSPLHSLWTMPSVSLVNVPSLTANLFTSASAKTRWGTLNEVPVYFASEGIYVGSYALLTQSAYDTADTFGLWTCLPIPLVTQSVYGGHGFLGWVQDMYYVSDNLVDADHFPGAGSKQFYVFGDIIQANEAGTPVVMY